LGTHKVSVESPEFKKATSDQYRLQINQSFRIDMTIQVGSPAESVMVEAQVWVTEIVNATLGQSVTSRPLVNCR